MNEYQIYVDGQPTNNFYKAYSKEKAIEEYKKDCTEYYKRDFGSKPDMSLFDWVDALKIYPIE